MSNNKRLDKTLKALRRGMAGMPDTEYGFDGRFETKRGKYDIHVDFELLGASIFEDKVELLVRVFEARHMPRRQDDELVDQIHQTMIDVIHGGDPDIDPDILSVNPQIMMDAIQYMDGDSAMDQMEDDILEMCLDQDMSLEELGEILNRLLDKIVGTMESKSERGLAALERLKEAQVGRQFGVSKERRLDYIN